MTLTGSLYIVATPIGNLEDISMRALKILKQVDVIAAEAPKHSQLLLEHYGIQKTLFAYHQHNEIKATAVLIKKLLAGKTVALISSAGTPLISDPGYQLVCAAHDNAITIIPIAGPSALITALSVAGLSTAKFSFEGYLPVKTHALTTRLSALKYEQRTLVIYEAAHRIAKTLQVMKTIFGGERRVLIARELTKKFEQLIRAKLTVVVTQLAQLQLPTKGEFVIVIEGVQSLSIADNEVLRISQLLAQQKQLSLKAIVTVTAQITQRRKNDVYQLIIKH